MRRSASSTCAASRDVDAVVLEHGKCAVAELDRVLRLSSTPRRSRRAQSYRSGDVAHFALDLAGHQVDLDDLRGARDAFGLGQRHGVARRGPSAGAAAVRCRTSVAR